MAYPHTTRGHKYFGNTITTSIGSINLGTITSMALCGEVSRFLGRSRVANLLSISKCFKCSLLRPRPLALKVRSVTLQAQCKAGGYKG